MYLALCTYFVIQPSVSNKVHNLKFKFCIFTVADVKLKLHPVVTDVTRKLDFSIYFSYEVFFWDFINFLHLETKQTQFYVNT